MARDIPSRQAALHFHGEAYVEGIRDAEIVGDEVEERALEGCEGAGEYEQIVGEV